MMNWNFLRPTLLATLVVATSAAAQSSTREPVRGPFWSGTIRGKGRNEIIAIKGIVVTVGEAKNAYLCYDTDLLRPSLAWTGQFLDFGNTLEQIAWPPPPQVRGNPVFSTLEGPGWVKKDEFIDPRPNRQGPLPKDRAHYRGLYVHGDKVVLAYSVGSTAALEMPGLEKGPIGPVFTRTLNLGASEQSLTFAVCRFDGGDKNDPVNQSLDGNARVLVVGRTNRLAVALIGGPNPLGTVLHENGQLWIKLPPQTQPTRLKVAIGALGSDEDIEKLRTWLKTISLPEDLAQFTRGGPARWTEPVATKGVRGAGEGPYVVDTLTEPYPNPWNIRTFFGGFDFFSDGRAAVCTFHGDVYVVSGIDDSLEKLAWRRYATGMFQPLGLKIVDGKVYVLGRDQITRLHDLNNDGEADFYENFNNDSVATPNYHEFSLDLHADSQGNFYYAKGSPWEPDITSPHQGCIIKVSKDGAKMEVFATGLRAPNGMGLGPHDEVTVSDNQGHWMPASKLNLVRKGGFYGMTPAAQRDLTLRYADGKEIQLNPSDPVARKKYGLKGWDGEMPIPTGYDEPIGWLPMNMDNSSGGQVWVTSDKWGPLKDHLLFMSYGKCTLLHVMMEEVDGVPQAGMVQFPLKFNSGIMRGRFNPRDGQLYLCGLKGWQTSATKDGAFYRVRYTGKPVHMPLALHARKNGVEVSFTSSLDAKSAADPQNYSVEQWNYQWTGNYGSPDFSVKNPNEKKHDRLEVKAAHLSADGKTVFLEIPDIQPCDQMRIKFNIDAADGTTIAQEIYNTIHKPGPEKKLE